jgi:hypothetical protein
MVCQHNREEDEKAKQIWWKDISNPRRWWGLFVPTAYSFFECKFLFGENKIRYDLVLSISQT